MQEGGKLYKDMNRLVAFYKGLSTWARWVDRSVDPSKTKVFFQGISPIHYEWVNSIFKFFLTEFKRGTIFYQIFDMLRYVV